MLQGKGDTGRAGSAAPPADIKAITLANCAPGDGVSLILS
jgi:hypothetical protein